MIAAPRALESDFPRLPAGEACDLREFPCVAWLRVDNGRFVMNEDIWKGQWKQVRGEVKQQWGKLTDDDLDQAAGARDKLVGRIQERYGRTREAVTAELDDWFKGRESKRTSSAGE